MCIIKLIFLLLIMKYVNYPNEFLEIIIILKTRKRNN